MFKILIDTCVWLDLAKDPRQVPVLTAIEEMINHSLIQLLVPSVTLDEFRRNRERIRRESAASLSSHLRLVKEAIDRVGGDKRKVRAVLSHLDDVNHKLPIVGGSAAPALDRIEKLLTAQPCMDASEGVRLRAAQRAIDKRAPFHRDKNAMADAIIFEIYAECARSKQTGTRYAFVTHNKAEFSVTNGNQKLPHPDLAECFTRIRSLYFINLPEALRRIEPSFISDAMFEHSWTQDTRDLQEIIKAEELLFHQVWYNRHQNSRISIERGMLKLVNSETYPRKSPTILNSVWKMARKSARRVESKYGKKNLGPFDDFEWGMVNGKLSALRWVLGDEWDMLDT